jgi:hypothetical protein
MSFNDAKQEAIALLRGSQYFLDEQSFWDYLDASGSGLPIGCKLGAPISRDTVVMLVDEHRTNERYIIGRYSRRFDFHSLCTTHNQVIAADVHSDWTSLQKTEMEMGFYLATFRPPPDSTRTTKQARHWSSLPLEEQGALWSLFGNDVPGTYDEVFDIASRCGLIRI